MAGETTPVVGAVSYDYVFASTTLSVPIPAWVTDGIEVVSGVQTGNGQTPSDIGAGLFTEFLSSPSDHLFAQHRRADATDEANNVANGNTPWGYGVSNGFIVVVALCGYSNTDPVTPYADIQLVNYATGASRDSPEVTSPATDSLFGMIMLSEHNSGTVTPPGGDVDVDVTGTSPYLNGTNWIAHAKVPSGPTGVRTWTAASAFGWAAVSFTFNAAGGGGGPTYTLSPAQGSYTLTGETINLIASRKLSAAQGSYALTGQTLSLRAARRLLAAQGSYVLTGETIGLIASRKLSAAQGSYALTGQPVGLIASRKLSAAQGSYALTGQPVGLIASRKLSAAQGSYALTGQPVDLIYTHVGAYILSAASGSYSLTGHPVGLIASRKLSAAQGSYTLTGETIGLIASRKLSAAQGSYALTGQPVGLIASRKLSAAQGSYALTGQAVGLVYTPHGVYVLSAGTGLYTLTGQPVGLRAARRLVTAPGAYVLTGQAVGLLRHYHLAAAQGSYTITGIAVGWLVHRRLTALAGTYAITGNPVSLTYSAAPIPGPGYHTSTASHRTKWQAAATVAQKWAGRATLIGGSNG